MKLGVDPEFFVLNEQNRPINAIRVCKYQSVKPLRKNNINIYHDNVLLEANCEPSLTAETFVGKMESIKSILLDLVGPNKLSLHGFAELTEEELNFPNSKDFGCRPDYDAYTLTINDTAAKELASTPFRTAGGHIHIGGNSDDAVCHPFLKPIFVFMLDLFLGIPSVLIDDSTQTFRRRKYFGLAGCHRDKSYGLEYRVLSPFWMRTLSTELLIYKLCEFVFNEMNESFYKKFINFDIEKLKGDNPETAYDFYGYDAKGVAAAINTCNVNDAKKYFNFACNFMPNELISHIEHEIHAPKPSILS